MSSIDDIILDIISDKKNSTNKEYQDEPIIFTASQMKNYTPPQIAKMRKIAQNVPFWERNDARIFHDQAVFMAEFEDNYSFKGEYLRFFPTYNYMTNQQLRGYFSWRTKVRHGQIEKTSLSFAFMYMYELLELIGADSPEDGFIKLRNFSEIYSTFDGRLSAYIKSWSVDYIVYYNLDRAFLNNFSEVIDNEAVAILSNADSKCDDDLFSAIVQLSSYNIEKSAFYKKNMEKSKTIICAVYRYLKTYFDNNRKISITEKLIGKSYQSPYLMFSSAVFYEEHPHPDCEYVINENYKYSCKNGTWYVDRFFTYGEKSHKLGNLIKCIDYYMRERFFFHSNLKPVESTKFFIKIINDTIDKYQSEQKKKLIPQINIDTSKLQSIRDISEITRDKLIVDEEENEELQSDIKASEDEEKEQKACLDSVESGLLRCLLSGDDYNEYCRKCGQLLSVLVDRINEDMFDVFDDTVIIYDGNIPVLLDDYTEELKGMI